MGVGNTTGNKLTRSSRANMRQRELEKELAGLGGERDTWRVWTLEREWDVGQGGGHVLDDGGGVSCSESGLEFVDCRVLCTLGVLVLGLCAASAAWS
jgi:hypothetical protein